MTFRVHRSERSRHLLLRGPAGEVLPEALVVVLKEEGVSCGWFRASGVLSDVDLRAFDARLGGLGSPRRIVGPVQVLSLEGSVGLTDEMPSVSMRALLAREGDHGLETLAGEITGARTVALEVLVTVLEDLSIRRSLDDAAGVWLLDSWAGAAGPAAVRGWSTALDASSQAEREPAPHSRSAAASGQGAVHSSGAQMPQRPARPYRPTDPPTLVPEAGDVVDHFAFGRCDVVRSEGDRLHLRVHKDGRIKEIALEMLRVTRLDGDDVTEPRRFKLERRI